MEGAELHRWVRVWWGDFSGEERHSSTLDLCHGLLTSDVRGRRATPHLAHGWVLLPEAHDDDAVGLADAALRPGGQRVVGLVEDDPVDVLLLAQPAGQAVLMDTGDRGSWYRCTTSGDTNPRNSLPPVERGGSKALLDDVTGQQEGGACGTPTPVSLHLLRHR